MMTPVAPPEPVPDAVPGRGGSVDTLCRPMLKARSEGELHAAVPALRPWLTSPDVRLKGFALGAFWAFKWTESIDATTPVTREQLEVPNFREQLAECAMAALVSEGVLRSPSRGWCDLGRILARGSEVWLTWLLWPDTPLPPLLRHGASAGEVAGMLGDVGLDAVGLDGPSISSTRFPALDGAPLLATRR